MPWVPITGISHDRYVKLGAVSWRISSQVSNSTYSSMAQYCPGACATEGTRAPNVRLVNLSRQDERLDAHLDAVMVWGERCRQQVLATYDSGDEMALFPLACLGITYSSSDDTVLISKLLENCRAVAPVDAAIDATTSGLRSNLLASKLTAALSWVDRRHALSVINHIIRDETPNSQVRCHRCARKPPT